MRDYCDAQAGFWLNSKFWSKFSSLPLSGIELRNSAPPPILENFRFGMTKVYSGLPPPPILENFRFGMTKVYSGLPPPHFGKLQIWDDQSLLQFTPPFYPPPREFQNTESYYMWRLYPTRITTSWLCGILVMSSLVFKARVDHSLACFFAYVQFSSGSTPADLLATSMAVESF